MASVQSAPNVSAQGGGVGLGPGRLPPKVTREQVQQAYLVPTSPPLASFAFDMQLTQTEIPTDENRRETRD